MQPYLSVIIPSYDEMANLQKGVLQKVRDFLEKKKWDYEVIIVDDGSKDGSVEFIDKFVKEEKSFRLIRNPHLGKAGAVTTGMLKARGKYVLFTDMDQATPIEEVDKLLPEFAKKYSVVIGSRSTRRKGSPLSRRLISRTAMILRRYVIGLDGITDTQCGFKMFTRDACLAIFTKIDEMHGGYKEISVSAVTAGFDVEILLLAQNMKYAIKEIPVSWLYVETRRVNPIRDSLQGVLDLLRIRKEILMGKYTLP